MQFHKMGAKIIVHKDFSHLEKFISSLPDSFSGRGEKLHDGRNKVKRFRIGREWIVVKKFKRPNIAQKIIYTFFKSSKAERAYLFAEKLRNLGINTPHEIGYIEIKRNCLLDESYFISTQCSYAALSQILDGADFSREAADALAGYLVELHGKGVLHGDLNLTNILYRIEDGKYEFTLIDTNRSTFKESPGMKECLENLKRLTHDREMMKYIISAYAQVRGWDKEAAVKDVMESLSRFEERIRRKRKFQKMTGLRK